MTERAQALEAIDQMLSYMVVNAADRRVLSAEIRLAVYGPPPAGPTRQPDTGPPPPPPLVGSPTTNILGDHICGRCWRACDCCQPSECQWCSRCAEDVEAQGGTAPLSTPVEPAGASEPPTIGQVRFCGALHVDTGAVCELPLDHDENHRGSFSRGIAQWPYIGAHDPTFAPVSPVEPTPEPPTTCRCLDCEPLTDPGPKPSEDDINRLEKAAWDSKTDLVLVWYRDRAEMFRQRLRETERAWQLDRKKPTVEPEPCVWRIQKEEDVTFWVSGCGVKSFGPAATWKCCPNCGAPLKVEREP